MLRSMYSGISGMKNFQQKLDVTANNISNVNTFGFKKGRATFKDMVSQQIAGATGPTDTSGGSNPRQVGLGTQLGSIDTIHTQGSLQNTNRELDLGVSGDGFFMVGEHAEGWPDGDLEDINLANEGANDVEEAYEGLNINYTRAGNFYLDEEGYIVNGDGRYLIGKTSTETADLDDDGEDELVGVEDVDDLNEEEIGRIQILTNAESFSIGGDGSVSFVNAEGDLRVAGQIQLAQFPNAEGLEKIGDNLYQETDNSGERLESNPGEDGSGELVAGTLEMSNVDLSEEFTEMITAQRGFQANTRGITTADEVLQELMNLKR
ncbi:flagellar basal body rod protein FlgG [Alteribacillus sp. JSM 102045]|uniref:flagellar basal body rod protein FlgG n=1 Tax=Alteribacillus sp. JSM 102045 TaxID=1562101 RepID=UPI0035C00F90